MRWIRRSGQGNLFDFAKAMAFSLAFSLSLSLVAFVPMPRWAMEALLLVCLGILLLVIYLIWSEDVRPRRR